MNPTVEAWIVIEKLGALCATPGISEDTQKMANEEIQRLMKDVIKPGLDKFTASSAGLILK
jgi:ribosome recycling factor